MNKSSEKREMEKKNNLEKKEDTEDEDIIKMDKDSTNEQALIIEQDHFESYLDVTKIIAEQLALPGFGQNKLAIIYWESTVERATFILLLANIILLALKLAVM
ncbi:hypothetical protein JD844_011914 [Phrynosoma platyrhinos]|uniref:Uncharacterized protein n=1 Tax=Phrynosoma platyrhinos TaxID=52577 RepID=A0ABQ7TIT3_PHRPL|nr:hypothetical protein JD844_011914 [Phrynosoma platyrhinos]